MKLTDDLLQKFNEQITLEFEASMVYRQLAIAADDLDLSGMAAWLRHQADEEIVHANKFIDHVADRDSFPTIGAIPAPPVQAGLSALEIFRAALAHEQKVSEAIREPAAELVPGRADRGGGHRLRDRGPARARRR